MQRQKRSLQVERYLCHRLFNRCYRPFLSQELTSVRLSPLLSPPWGNADLSSRAGRVKRRINVCVCVRPVCKTDKRGYEMGCSMSGGRKEVLRNLQIPFNLERREWRITKYEIYDIYVSIIRCTGTNVCKGCFSSLILHKKSQCMIRSLPLSHHGAVYPDMESLNKCHDLFHKGGCMSVHRNSKKTAVIN